ncbi:DNA polymerase III subunit epsilon [Pseudanabaena sp. SR411]|uniref:3'-5' exonuclease n=1 Tax=Pseudanabaena sp. SR411 TaxID=1980935 RepID=UPI000B9804F6|nr:3'-5' exonuclease [Pseudanabaena sp. SR411]OYQ62159.1 DNA polymerase III subunit epsilon [Pseudanabaena sp. SR411]
MQTTTKLSTELLAYYRGISTEVFTVVDLETTGVVGNCDRIIEISVLQATLKDGIQQISTDLINPQILIPEQIARFTGISQDMVDSAAGIDKVLPNYLPMLQTGILTAHNFSFDYAFLQAEYRRLGVDFKAPVQLCTVELSRLLLANLQSRSLPKLVKYFGFKVGASHRAESDAIACWLLLEKLLTQIQTADDQEILDMFGQQWLSAKDIGVIFQLPVSKVESLLIDSSIKSRFSRHRQINLYQRKEVENLVDKMRIENSREFAEQLSLPLYSDLI